jgi:UDP-N-acetylmuramate dehydrogenase
LGRKSGENWQQFVLWTIDQNFGGLENMSLIPGNVELLPVQNIEIWNEIKDTFISCEALTTINHELKTFKKKIAISDIGKYLQKMK